MPKLRRLAIVSASLAGFCGLSACSEDKTERPAADSGMNAQAMSPEPEPGSSQTNGGASGFNAPPDTDVVEPEPSSGGAGADADNDGAPTEDNPIVSCEQAMGSGDDPLLDDFDDLDMQTLMRDNRAGQWYQFDDTTPDGALSLEFDETDGPDGSLNGALHVTSSGWFEWGSGLGFVVRYTITGNEICQYDASAYDGFHFWAKGTGTPTIVATTPDVIPIEEGGACSPIESCYDVHNSPVVLTEEWQEYTVLFEDMVQQGWGVAVGALDTSAIFAVQFQMGPSVDFDFWIDDLAFFKQGIELGDAGVDSGAVALPPAADAAAPDAATRVSTDAGSDSGATPKLTSDASLAAVDASADGGT